MALAKGEGKEFYVLFLWMAGKSFDIYAGSLKDTGVKGGFLLFWWFVDYLKIKDAGTYC